MWGEWVAGITQERADMVRWFLVRLRTEAGMEEVVTAMMAAMAILERPGGAALADRLAQRRAAEPGAESES